MSVQKLNCTDLGQRLQSGPCPMEKNEWWRNGSKISCPDRSEMLRALRGDVSTSARNVSLSGIGDVNPRAGYASSWVSPQRHNWQVILFFWHSFWRLHGRTIKSAFLAGRAVFNVKAPPFVEAAHSPVTPFCALGPELGEEEARHIANTTALSKCPDWKPLNVFAQRIKCQTRVDEILRK